ncbi:uncharacterized protein K02A2.6-like [Aedes albopictus]|uniref:Integrase catalytic domain-containing protein n=1 Tax=Aedes albopictus TaxID=7160 RepID=A0ABM1YRJ1_AEDAL
MPTGEYVLVVIDYYSRFMELEIMTKITAFETIKRLNRIFRTWGPPRTITLDNAKQFVSTEFEEFCKNNGVHLNHTSPYWPQANGEVERQNRSLLKRMRISHALYDDWKAELHQYLQLYNNTPHSVTGVSPNELLQNRKVRTKLPHVDDLETIPPSTDFRDRDLERKTLGKEREDAKQLERNKEYKGAVYKSLAEEVPGEGVEVRALTAEPTRNVKNIDEVTEAQELVTALRQQYEEHK